MRVLHNPAQAPGERACTCRNDDREALADVSNIALQPLPGVVEVRRERRRARRRVRRRLRRHRVDQLRLQRGARLRQAPAWAQRHSVRAA